MEFAACRSFRGSAQRERGAGADGWELGARVVGWVEHGRFTSILFGASPARMSGENARLETS